MSLSIRKVLYQDYLEDEEEIFFVGHRHVFIMLRDFGRLITLHGALPFILWLFFPQMFWIYLGWAALGVIRLLLVIQDWYYDCWLITNMGIVGVEWTGYFDRTSDRVEYQSIEGVSYKIKGIIPTIFNFGNITLAKLGGPTTVTLKSACNPKRIEKNVVKYQDKFMTKKNFTDQEVLKQLISDMVSTHVQNHGMPKEAEDEGKLRKFSKKEK
ncbi:hypothetical protein ACFL10_01455 [Patescibacteria group bacterium]